MPTESSILVVYFSYLRKNVGLQISVFCVSPWSNLTKYRKNGMLVRYTTTKHFQILKIIKDDREMHEPER
jgi:hypothetical protein